MAQRAEALLSKPEDLNLSTGAHCAQRAFPKAALCPPRGHHVKHGEALVCLHWYMKNNK